MANAEPKPSKKRRSTSTSEFGVGKREGHDATDFYARFSPPEISGDDTIDDDPSVRRLDRIIRGSSADMSAVADGSVALVVTSPPYFAGKAYETELDADHVPSTYIEYLQMLRGVFAECVRTLEPGGRIAVNVANLGRRPYRSLAADVTSILQDDLRLLLRGEVVWVKQRGASGSCAWGSFQRATNPVLRDLTERVIIASKGRFDRAVPQPERAKRGLPNESSLYKDEFMEATLDMWEIAPESARRVGHPAPFPVELPERLINLYTYVGDLVLDPFMGSGTTAVAAVRTDRHYVGYDTDDDYIDAAEQRIDAARAEHAQREQRAGATSSVTGLSPRIPVRDDDPQDFQARSVVHGRAAREMALEMLQGAGFEANAPIEVGAKVAGIEVNFVARDAGGRRIIVDTSGAFNSSRPGLKRTDTLWKALGRVSVICSMLERDDDGDTGTDIVLLSTDVPAQRSAGGKALLAALDAGTIVEVLTMDEAGIAVLGQLCKGLRPGDDGWVGSGWTRAR